MSALGSLWRRRRDRPLLVGISLVVLATLLASPVVDWVLRGLQADASGFDWRPIFHFNDFGAYTTALARWSQGQVIYWQNGDTYFATYLYPPVYLPLFLPFVRLAEQFPVAAVPLANTLSRVAALLWGIASVLYLWVGLQLVARELGLELAWYDRVVGLWALIGFQPLLFSVKLGQVSAFVTGTFCLAFVATERSETTSSEGSDQSTNPGYALATGVLAAVASGIKLYYATAGAYLLRDWRRLVGGLAAGVGLLGLSVLVFGVENNLAYLDVLTWGKGWGTQPEALYLWHPGYFEPLYPVSSWLPSLSMVLRFGLVAGVALLALLARNADADRTTFALGLGAYTLAAPEVYTQDFVALLLVAGVLVAVELDREDGYPWIPVAAVGLLQVHAYGWLAIMFHLSGGPPFVGLRETIVPLFQPGLWGCLLLVGLAGYRTAAATGRLDALATVRRRVGAVRESG